MGPDGIAVGEIDVGETDGLLVGLLVGLGFVGFVASVECIIIRYSNKVSSNGHKFTIYNYYTEGVQI